MRYFFHLVSDQQTIPDDVGMELPSVQAAIDGARKAVEDLIHESPNSVDEWYGWRLQITDEFGQIYGTIVLEVDDSSNYQN